MGCPTIPNPLEWDCRRVERCCLLFKLNVYTAIRNHRPLPSTGTPLSITAPLPLLFPYFCTYPSVSPRPFCIAPSSAPNCFSFKVARNEEGKVLSVPFSVLSKQASKQAEWFSNAGRAGPRRGVRDTYAYREKHAHGEGGSFVLLPSVLSGAVIS